MKHVGNWKIVDGDAVFLKVIDFPVPEDSGLGGESMWVRQLTGTDLEGTGELNNEPYFCTEVRLGDVIKYGGGTDETKPRYVKKVNDAQLV